MLVSFGNLGTRLMSPQGLAMLRPIGREYWELSGPWSCSWIKSLLNRCLRCTWACQNYTLTTSCSCVSFVRSLELLHHVSADKLVRWAIKVYGDGASILSKLWRAIWQDCTVIAGSYASVPRVSHSRDSHAFTEYSFQNCTDLYFRTSKPCVDTCWDKVNHRRTH